MVFYCGRSAGFSRDIASDDEGYFPAGVTSGCGTDEYVVAAEQFCSDSSCAIQVRCRSG